MAERHFFEQREHAKSYLIPLFQKYLSDFESFRVLEIGCAEAGFLDALHDIGIETVGLELEAHRVRIAMEKNPVLNIIVGDISDKTIGDKIKKSFNLIVLKDVIEHIADRPSIFQNINSLLKKDGYLYITFPPKFSPFGGHQQNGSSVLRFIPYLHLFPEKLVRISGDIFHERQNLIEEVIFHSKEGLSIRTFEKYCDEFSLFATFKNYYLIRPIHKTRFKISSRKIPDIPLVREFITFGCEYLLRKRK